MNLIEKESVHLAYEYAKVSDKDIESASLLYSNRLYPQACYFLQQSVEKTAKSYGLLMGSIKAEELIKDVGHLSAISLLYHFDGTYNKYFEAFNILVDDLVKANKMKKDVGDLIKLRDKLDKVDRSQLSFKPVIEQIQNPEFEKLMWNATINLDRNDSMVNDALTSLEKSKWSRIEPFLPIIQILIFKRGPAINCYLHLIKVSWRVGPLTLITMWHEKTTRYPPIKESDYWNLDAYNAQTQLIKRFKFLNKHARISSKEILKATFLAKKAIE